MQHVGLWISTRSRVGTMSEAAVKSTLSALRGAVNQLGLYPAEHPAVEEAVALTAKVADILVGGHDEVVLSVIGDSLYLGRTLLPHTSLEFHGFIRELQAAGIDSMTLAGHISTGDVVDLACLVAGRKGDVPAEGTIRLNTSPFTVSELQAGAQMSGLRTSYARSLDVLRGIGMAVGLGQDFDLSGASLVVGQLLEQTLSQPGASVLLSTMKSHDEYTFYHSVNVCILSITLGRSIGMDEDALGLMALGALLHDIGKLRVDAAILQYPGRLNPAQWAEIKLHPQEGALAILAAADAGQEVAAVVALEHHGRFDGAGYPPSSGSREQHLFSRVVTAVDVYDALTTRRSYRRAESPHQAINVLRQGAGSHFDPDVVRALLSLVGEYPPGSMLRLEDGRVVLVTASRPNEPPEAVAVTDSNGRLLETPQPLRLEVEVIVEIVMPESVGIDPASMLEQVTVE